MPKVPSTHWLTEAQLAVLAGPRRQDIFECFSAQECLSANDVQARLGLDSKTVYYHLGKLLGAGLLVACGEQGRAASYRRVAVHIRMPEGFQGGRYEKLAARSVSAKLRKSMRQFARAAELSADDPSLVDSLYIGSGRLDLTREQIQELKDRLRELLLEFRAKESPGEKRRVRVVCALTPDI